MNIKNILITGGTGSLGQALVRHFLNNKNYKKIVVYSRDELKQFEMQKQFSPNQLKRIRFFIGDIRDLNRLKIAFNNIDLVIHAAALKQVDTAEYNPTEYIKTNIYGAQNIIEACFESNIKKVIALSTDKATSPINLYGATKLCSDKLFIAAGNFMTKTNFSIIKYGNVVSSRGSVIPVLKKQFLNKQKYLTITDPEMTRFSLEMNKCLKIIDWSIINSQGSEIIIPKLKSYKILELAKAINSKIKIKIIGIRPGEKISEEMISVSESRYCYDIGDYYILIPNKNLKTIKHYKKKFKAKLVENNFHYDSSSNRDFLTIKELRNIISKN